MPIVPARFKKIIYEENFLSLAGNISAAAFGFLSFALLARSFDKNIFGEWVLYISSAGFVEMFRFGLTRTAIIRFLSGAKEEQRKELMGSNWLIGLIASILIAIILLFTSFLFHEPIHKAGYGLFFTWYPLLAFANMPFNNALSVFQADQRFDKILLIRTLTAGTFFLFVLLNFFINFSIVYIVIGHLIINASASALCILKGWDGLSMLRKASSHANKTILNFGKYTTLTLIGTNLLKSADTLIISLSPMGPTAVALYSIPLKLTELLAVPLRSFAATAFPKMSRASIKGEIQKVKDLFYTYSGAMTLLFIPVAIACFFLSDLAVLILGGSQYLGTDPLTGASTSQIFKIFAIYSLFLPIDRITGVGLDSINKPKQNFYKVIFMVIANIIGDIIAVFVLKSLLWVAVVTILFTIIGVILGFIFIDKELKLKFNRIFTYGWGFYMMYLKKIRSKS